MRRIIVLAAMALLAAACDGYVAGSNGQGQLGLGNGVSGPGVVNVNSAWDTLVTSSFTTCGITQDDTLWCWGDNSRGQTGNGTTTGDQFTPNQVDTNTDWQHVSPGYRHTCAIRSGQMWCWGSDTFGQLGNGTATTGSQGTPQRVGTNTDWESVATGDNHSCGIRNNGDLYCWGNNTNGEIGDGTTTNRFTPVAVGAALAPWQQVDGGLNHTCAITTTGTAHCWGNNTNGQLGNGTTTNQTTPATQVSDSGIFDPDTPWKSISAGDNFTCGIRAPVDGNEWWQTSGYCWGNNDDGQIHVSPSVPDLVAAPMDFGIGWENEHGSGAFVGTYVSAISAGRDHVCAVSSGTVTGRVIVGIPTIIDSETRLDSFGCQGSDEYGQISDIGPVIPSSANLVAVSAGARHTVVTAWEL